MPDILLTDETGGVILTSAGYGLLLGTYNSPYSAADFGQAMLNLLPHGPVWPREAGAVLPQVVDALSPTWERLTGRAVALLGDSPVGALAERLPEWEATLGLPDPCAGIGPTDAVRNAAVRAQIAARGGQSVPYFTNLAMLLGMDITVQEFSPCQAEVASADDPCNEPDWAFVWWATRAAPNASAECTLQRFVPAHTQLFFLIG